MTRLMELQCGAIGEARRSLDGARASAAEAPRRASDFIRRADWLPERFPNARPPDVEGLMKLFERGAVESHVRRFTSGRYVGVAPAEEDEDSGFDGAIREIHIELEGLNEEAVELALQATGNFEELGT